MWENRLTKQQVLYYCNWTLGMTHQELADAFCTTRDAVTHSLKRLREKWPELFLFTSPKRLFHYDPDKHDKYVVRAF